MADNVGFAEGFNKNLGTAQFGDNKVVSGSKEFLMSNTIVAKFSFLLLVVIAFFIILRLVIQIVMWLNTPNPDPYVVTCRRDGSESKNVPVNPKIKNSIPILRSKDEREGIEFTWSVWLFLDKVHGTTSGNTDSTSYYHIFSKGTKGGILSQTNHDAGPGLYLKAEKTVSGSDSGYKNSLYAVMNTLQGEKGISMFGNIDSGIEIDNVPIRKWFHVALRIENRNFDVYVNGVLYKRKVLSSLPRQNYGDIHLSQEGIESTATGGSGDGNGFYGFNGEMSSLRYFNSALNPVEISNIVRVGPNMCTDEANAEYPPYFSSRWYNI